MGKTCPQLTGIRRTRGEPLSSNRQGPEHPWHPWARRELVHPPNVCRSPDCAWIPEKKDTEIYLHSLIGKELKHVTYSTIKLEVPSDPR